MEFTTLGRLALRIKLDKSDMEKYGVCYDDMDYSSARTNRIIWDLLDKAKDAQGFDTDGKKLHIQIFPSKQGGCELYISKLTASAVTKNEKCFRFGSLDEALLALVYLKKSGLLLTARLFSRGTAWYIIADAELGEYGKSARIDAVGEHARLICGGSGLLKLIEALS